MEAIRWEQYTPYFNDGDVCEFDVHVPEIKVNDRAEAAADEWDDDEYHTIYSVFIEGGYPRRWVRNEGSWGGRWEKYGDEIPRHDDYDAFSELTHAMEKGHFEELLYEKFGDHAQVTVYRDRIAVETYEHE
uniref:Uncharacterized protein n=1 Tax=Nonomuraea gerenzanensis TaxID=93944 RepID=A0A1M4DVH9_9ACTN|nr:hypothetical protein BN4615_P98 [Nonomuraea gerenzanensis]